MLTVQQDKIIAHRNKPPLSSNLFRENSEDHLSKGAKGKETLLL
jgi:hypothetical protein